jgi:hypothetical protein
MRPDDHDRRRRCGNGTGSPHQREARSSSGSSANAGAIRLHPVRRVVIAAADGNRHGNRSRRFTKMVKVPSRPEPHRSRTELQ